jgi:DNA-binding response OmpR family regulator
MIKALKKQGIEIKIRPNHATGEISIQPGREGQPVVLIAFEGVMIRNLMTNLLQNEGYCVISTSSGYEALEVSRTYHEAIDLVLTDATMPQLGCSDLCSRLLEERPGINVLVMSGEQRSEIVSQSATLPFLPKPLDGEMLMARVRTILDAPVQSSPYVYLVFRGFYSWMQRMGMERPNRAQRLRRHERKAVGSAICAEHAEFAVKC